MTTSLKYNSKKLYFIVCFCKVIIIYLCMQSQFIHPHYKNINIFNSFMKIHKKIYFFSSSTPFYLTNEWLSIACLCLNKWMNEWRKENEIIALPKAPVMHVKLTCEKIAIPGNVFHFIFHFFNDKCANGKYCKMKIAFFLSFNIYWCCSSFSLLLLHEVIVTRDVWLSDIFLVDQYWKSF